MKLNDNLTDFEVRLSVSSIPDVRVHTQGQKSHLITITFCAFARAFLSTILWFWDYYFFNAQGTYDPSVTCHPFWPLCWISVLQDMQEWPCQYCYHCISSWWYVSCLLAMSRHYYSAANKWALLLFVIIIFCNAWGTCDPLGLKELWRSKIPGLAHQVSAGKSAAKGYSIKALDCSW